MQSLPGSVQFVDYSTASAAVAHVATIVTSNLTARNSMLLGVSYDGATGNLVSSITDSDGNTWAKATSGSNSVQTNGELWYCTNLVGGTKPSVTVNFSSAVKATIVLVEVSGIISYKSALDIATTRVNATSGVGRFGTSTGVRNGQVEAIFQMAMANSTTTSFTGGTTAFNGAPSNFHTKKDATTGLSVAYSNRNAEIYTIATVAPGFVITPSSVVPVVVLCAAFFREGVITGTAEDGTLQNIEGVVVEDTTVGNVIKTSGMAPNGGTGSSTDSKFYGFLPSPGLPANASIVSAEFNYSIIDGFDDGLSTGLHILIDKTAPIGSTLETTDENGVGGTLVLNGDMDVAPGIKSIALTPATDINISGYTNTMFFVETTVVTGSYWQIADRSNNAPQFIEMILSFSSGVRLLASTGVGT